MKSFVALAVVALFAAVSCGPAAPKNFLVEKMKKLTKEHIEHTIDHVDLGEHGDARNVVVKADVNVEKWEGDAKTGITFSVTVKAARVVGHLRLIHVGYPVVGIDMNGEGDASAGLDELRVAGTFVLADNSIKDISDLEIHITGAWAELSGNFDDVEKQNQIIKELLPLLEILDLGEIVEQNKAVALEIANKIWAALSKQ